MSLRHTAIVLAWLLPAPLIAADKPARPVNETIKEVAGTAEFLRSVPKRFATLQAVDVVRRRVTLLIDGETLAKVWPVVPDAEIKIDGWWGRLDQLTPGDRVWVWFQTNRTKQAVAVAMLADEPSEQDIHGRGLTLVKRDAAMITVKDAKGKEHTLKTAGGAVPAAGQAVYVQTAGGKVRRLLDAAAFEAARARQKAALRKLWAEEGLPGTVTFLHRFSGEMELMLDHEAIRWGRSLKVGDKVNLPAKPPIVAVVKSVRPWRERTQLRLVVNSFDLTDLRLAQRTHLRMPPPPPVVDTAVLPPDVDRPRATKAERLEWFLASVYCTCKVSGNVCTGHFYTLASCNPNGCGMPNRVRKLVAAKIDKGLSDRQIFEELLRELGPNLVRPHLLP